MRRLMSSLMAVRAALWAAIFMTVTVAVSRADDWPEIRGKGRLGEWNETGILDKFPEGGLKVLWRTPIRAGYSGPAVADGRVFVLDYVETQRPRGTERAVALDQKTGKILWTREWPVDYRGISWPVGPRATPTVDGDRVYVAGADGKLLCLNVANGDVIWKKDYVTDYGADRLKWAFDWGFASSPIVDGGRLICLVGGRPDAKVVAFDKMTGREIWRALSSDSDLGVAQPIIITAGGSRQLIIWYPGAVASLDPITGKTYWEQPYKVGASMTVA
ncbi:MAG: pyrrolo-quinoline quinone, partial [Acidobacteria bacterium]